MVRAGVAAALIALAGCQTLQSVNLSLLCLTADEGQDFYGSPREVERSAVAAMEAMGVTATVMRDTYEEVRLSGTTASGKRFFLTLTQQSGRNKTFWTRVRVKWIDGPDAETWKALVVRIPNPRRPEAE